MVAGGEAPEIAGLVTLTPLILVCLALLWLNGFELRTPNEPKYSDCMTLFSAATGLQAAGWLALVSGSVGSQAPSLAAVCRIWGALFSWMIGSFVPGQPNVEHGFRAALATSVLLPSANFPQTSDVPELTFTAHARMGTPIGAPEPTGWAGSVSWPQSVMRVAP